MQDFDQFQMPPALLQQLYNDSVFSLNKIDENSTLIPDPPLGFRVIGTARNKLAVVVKQPSSVSGPSNPKDALSQPSRMFLESILKACKIEIGDTLILLLSEAFHPEDMQSALQLQGVNQVLMFGVTPADLGLPAVFPAYQPQKLADRKFLWAPPLEELEDKESKKTLWASLKQFFGI
jgi:hypothetical protein